MKNRSAVALCAIWNRATDPSKLRTDHQHRRNDQLANVADNHMARMFRAGREWVTLPSGERRATHIVNPFTGEITRYRRTA